MGGVLTPIYATQVGCRPYSADDNCPCIQLSDHCPARWLALMPRELPPSDGRATAPSTRTNERSCVEPCLETGRPGSVPFVSDRPGAYGRLLLAVYVQWRTGVLVPS